MFLNSWIFNLWLCLLLTAKLFLIVGPYYFCDHRTTERIAEIFWGKHSRGLPMRGTTCTQLLVLHKQCKHVEVIDIREPAKSGEKISDMRRATSLDDWTPTLTH